MFFVNVAKQMAVLQVCVCVINQIGGRADEEVILP
jgi:hypothetical protein